MKNLISKELHEIRTRDKHLKEKLNKEESSTFYCQKLIELSKRTASGFSVEGDLPILTLKFGKFNWVFGILFIIFLGFFIAGAFKNIEEPIYLLFPLLILVVAILHAKLWSLSNKITIDCKRKNLLIESDHWLGRYFESKRVIPFSEIKSFDKKLKRYRAKGQMTLYRYRIILKTKSKEYQLFEIPHGPIYYINEKSMIQAIKGIIKNAT